MSNPIRERFCEETGFSGAEARQLCIKAELATQYNEHECKGDPHPAARDAKDKNQCAELWCDEVLKVTREMMSIARRQGYTVEYTGLRPCLKRAGQYVEIPS